MVPAPTSKLQEVSVSQALTLAEERYRAGAYHEAATIFQRIADSAPDHPQALRMLGLCRLRLGDPPGALELLAKARALAPSDGYAQLHYGLGLHAVGRHSEAAEQFRVAAALLPDDPAAYLNLSSAMLALGEGRQALDAARRARRRGRELPEAHYALGLALLACDRFADAAEAFAACVRRAPNFGDGWVNLGVALYRKGDIESAKAAMRRALEVQPANRAAAANLAAFLRLTGEIEAADAMLSELVARDPDSIEARLNLAAALLQEERAAEALAVLDARRPPIEPNISGAWAMQRSLALLQLRRPAEAEQALAEVGDGPPATRPLLLWRRTLLAQAKGDIGAAQRIAGEMEAMLGNNAAMLPEHRIMAHFDLAKFWSRQRQDARAFPHWREGHRLLGRMQPFSREASGSWFDAQIAAFSRERLAQGPRASNRDPTPVFIVGMPRSGTTLAEQIIAAHPQAFGAGERGALGRAFAALGGEARIAALDATALDLAAEPYLAELHALAPAALRIIDKMPGNFSYLGLAALLLPGARIIHCVRDPRDIGLSIFTFRFYGYHPYAHDLADLGWYIGEHERLMAHWRAALPNPILALPLKDWVEDFSGTLVRVLAFLDLPFDPACERFYEQDTRVRTVSRSQVREPVNARGLGRWRAYESELAPLIAALVESGALAAE